MKKATFTNESRKLITEILALQEQQKEITAKLKYLKELGQAEFDEYAGYNEITNGLKSVSALGTIQQNNELIWVEYQITEVAKLDTDKLYADFGITEEVLKEYKTKTETRRTFKKASKKTLTEAGIE